MAYLTFAGSKENQTSCFKFIGANNNNTHTGLISDNTSLISSNSSLISNNDTVDTCSFYSGPSDATIYTFGESCGSVALYDNVGESCGSVAYSGVGESCGSVAYSSTSSSSSSACCYSC